MPCLFVCTCVSVDLLMPVDEWAFMRVPQSGFSVHACVLPTRGLSLSTR